MYLASEDFYEDIFSELNEAITVLNTNQEIIWGNQAAAELLGYGTPEEIIGRDALLFVSSEYHYKIQEQTQQFLDTGINHKGNFLKLIKKDGSVLGCYSKSSLLELDTGTVIVNIARPFEFEVIDERLLSFIQSLRHEVNTPVSVIWGLAEMIEHQHGEDLTPEIVQSLQTIMKNARRLADISENMVSMESLQNSINRAVFIEPMEGPVDFEEVERNVLHEFETCYGVKFFEVFKNHELLDEQIPDLITLIDLFREHERQLKEGRQMLEMRLFTHRMERYTNET